MQCLSWSVRGFGFAVLASAMDRCSLLCLPWLILLPKISLVLPARNRVTVLNPASLQNQEGLGVQSLSFQQPWGLSSVIDIPTENIVSGWNTCIDWAHGVKALPCMEKEPSLGGNGKDFLFNLFLKKRKLTYFPQKGQHFFHFGGKLYMLQNSKLSMDWDAATPCNNCSQPGYSC